MIVMPDPGSSWTLAVILVALGAGLTPAGAQQPAKVPTVG
jgi:hypothetical protein